MQRVPAALVSGLDIPQETRLFLETAGLPTAAVLPQGLRYEIAPVTAWNGDPPGFRCGLLDLVGDFYVIGSLERVSLFGIERVTGGIFLFEPGTRSPLFVNHGIAEFQACVDLFMTLGDSIDFGELRAAWTRIDPMAMSYDEYYWPIGIEDMEALSF